MYSISTCRVGMHLELRGQESHQMSVEGARKSPIMCRAHALSMHSMHTPTIGDLICHDN